MKSLLLAATALVFAATVNLSPAAATEPNGNGNAWPDYGQTAGSGTSGTVTRTPHYEWQYHYVGRHPRWRGHWALVR